MPYLQVSFTCERNRLDQVEEQILDLNPVSLSREPLYEPEVRPTSVHGPWASARISVLLDAASKEVARLRVAMAQLAVSGIQFQYLADTGWHEKYREQLAPIQCGDVWVKPFGSKPVPGARTTVFLEPGLAFGSGSHESTRLCIEWLASLDLKDKHVLDAGCGSGILGITALKLGAAKVVGVDTDPQALIATADNARKNRVEVELSDALEGGATYDVIVANILANTLIELAASLQHLLNPGGKLALAGVLESQAESVASAYPQVQFEPIRAMNDWVVLHGSKAAD